MQPCRVALIPISNLEDAVLIVVICLFVTAVVVDSRLRRRRDRDAGRREGKRRP